MKSFAKMLSKKLNDSVKKQNIVAAPIEDFDELDAQNSDLKMNQMRQTEQEPKQEEEKQEQ